MGDLKLELYCEVGCCYCWALGPARAGTLATAAAAACLAARFLQPPPRARSVLRRAARPRVGPAPPRRRTRRAPARTSWRWRPAATTMARCSTATSRPLWCRWAGRWMPRCLDGVSGGAHARHAPPPQHQGFHGAGARRRVCQQPRRRKLCVRQPTRHALAVPAAPAAAHAPPPPPPTARPPAPRPCPPPPRRRPQGGDPTGTGKGGKSNSTHLFTGPPLNCARSTNDPPAVQGGDPTGTGKGGKSIYGTPNGKFPDEIADHLKHNKVGACVCWMGGRAEARRRCGVALRRASCWPRGGGAPCSRWPRNASPARLRAPLQRGVVSMANSGPNTNGSQVGGAGQLQRQPGQGQGQGPALATGPGLACTACRWVAGGAGVSRAAPKGLALGHAPAASAASRPAPRSFSSPTRRTRTSTVGGAAGAAERRRPGPRVRPRRGQAPAMHATTLPRSRLPNPPPQARTPSAANPPLALLTLHVPTAHLTLRCRQVHHLWPGHRRHGSAGPHGEGAGGGGRPPRAGAFRRMLAALWSRGVVWSWAACGWCRWGPPTAPRGCAGRGWGACVPCLPAPLASRPTPSPPLRRCSCSMLWPRAPRSCTAGNQDQGRDDTRQPAGAVTRHLPPRHRRCDAPALLLTLPPMTA